MKAFISVDMEGMPYIVIPGHLGLKGTLYSEARKIATKVTLTVAEELNKNGVEEIVVADSHGPMVNLLVEDLPEYVEIVRGFPRPVSMVAGVEGCDIALFLGYHAKFGTSKSTFDHTYSGGSINKVKVNGVEVSEFLLNAYAAGDYKVPVVLVAGEAQLLKDDVKKYAPWAETVALKHSFGRLSARSFGLARIEKELKEATKRAVANFKQKTVKPLTAKKPVKMEITFLTTHFADAAELLPIIKRVDGLNVEYATNSMIEAYKIFEFLVIAASGISALLQNVQ
ncbi:MAG: M55 family metallopeptidase [Candidatus Bathyarchaeota archaeon]|jgi:D-amino peptidase|nr:M55 family metallopeptidase [Candidatus Bathyarchaeota archaeon]